MGRNGLGVGFHLEAGTPIERRPGAGEPWTTFARKWSAGDLRAPREPYRTCSTRSPTLSACAPSSPNGPSGFVASAEIQDFDADDSQHRLDPCEELEEQCGSCPGSDDQSQVVELACDAVIDVGDDDACDAALDSGAYECP